MIDHTETACARKYQDVDEEDDQGNQFGPWLRGQSMGISKASESQSPENQKPSRRDIRCNDDGRTLISPNEASSSNIPKHTLQQNSNPPQSVPSHDTTLSWQFVPPGTFPHFTWQHTPQILSLIAFIITPSSSTWKPQQLIPETHKLCSLHPFYWAPNSGNPKLYPSLIPMSLAQ